MNIEKIIPAYKSIIWGGEKLKTHYGKDTDLSPLAESWELSFHKDGKCTLLDGRALSDVATADDLGKNCQGFDFFPVLVKFIDACDKLSVQVHPADEYALANENSLGKTEMWYIADADEGAGIYLGFKEEISRETFERAIRENTLTDYLKFIPVKPGESYFIPAGLAHAICGGILIAEIQQNSDLTYRIYDYDRVGANGKKRELHVERALDAVRSFEAEEINAIRYSRGGESDPECLADSEYFSVYKIALDGERTFCADRSSFHSLLCVKRKVVIEICLLCLHGSLCGSVARIRHIGIIINLSYSSLYNFSVFVVRNTASAVHNKGKVGFLCNGSNDVHVEHGFFLVNSMRCTKCNCKGINPCS